MPFKDQMDKEAASGQGQNILKSSMNISKDV
jgi:hypothetical protein